MMILKGTVVGVVDKGTPEKPWAIVGIQSLSLNRNGLPQTDLYELSVFGDAAKQGLQNSYRSQMGVEVFAPFTTQYDEKYKKTQYQLTGIPQRLAEQRPVQSGPSSAQQVASK
jgi:hypothetical protein